MKTNNNHFKWFTLVELIIVITILWILATIAFISFQSYSKNARDGNRVTTMKNISKWLDIYKVQTWNYPKPDNSFNVEASWKLIWYQWIIWDPLSRLINVNKTPTDPFDNSNYVYSINSDNTKYQILWYLETSDYLSLLNQSYAAVDYSNRYVKNLWDKVWVILDINKSPISWVTKVDVATWSTTYNVYFWDNDNINWSWSVLFSNMYTRRKDLQNNKNLASLDNSLVWYWDFNWTLTDKSSKWNSMSWIIDYSDWVNWKAWLFKSSNWDNSTKVQTWYTTLFDISNTFSLNMWLKKNSSTATREFRVIWNRYNWNDPNWWYITFPTNEYLWLSVGSMSWTHMMSNKKLEVWEWYNISLIFNNWLVNLYINWEKQKQQFSWANYVTSSRSLAIWWMTDSPIFWFDGLIDEVRIYNRALSDSEIQELYNSIK